MTWNKSKMLEKEFQSKIACCVMATCQGWVLDSHTLNAGRDPSSPVALDGKKRWLTEDRWVVRSLLDQQRCIEKLPHADFSDLMADLKNVICTKIGSFLPRVHQERTRPFGIGCVTLSSSSNHTNVAPSVSWHNTGCVKQGWRVLQKHNS